MLRRRRARDLPQALDPERASVAEAWAAVEDARAWLVSAAPRGRPSRVHLAEALAGFEDGLRRARSTLELGVEGRPRVQELLAAIDDSLRGAERLRLEADPQDYGELVAEIDRLLAPLEAFEGLDAKDEGRFDRPS